MDKGYYDKIKNTEVSAEQHFKTAVLKVMSQMDTFLTSVAFDYLEKVKISFGELMETVKQLPSSEYLNQVDKELHINSPLSQYLNAYFGVQPGDDEALRYKLHDMYMTWYDDRNNTFEEQLARSKKLALANLQEQMDKLRQQVLDNGDYVAPDPWRLESEEYRENRKSKSRLTSDLLDMPQGSYLKEWKPNDTIPLAVTNRWELLTYHLNSIAKANRSYEHHPNSYWNNKRQKMRNDKDFIIGLNVLGLTLATLLKCYGLVDSDNSEDMYFLNIFKDALIYHLMQFHINTNQVYDFLTQLIYSQHCDHPIGSIKLFGYPDSYHRILEILVQSCSILFSQEPNYRMKHHFPHLNMVETRQLLKWLSDIKSQKCVCDYHLGYPLHGSPAYMEAPLPTYDQVRNEVHRETPDVGQHDLSIYYKDTIIMRILMRVHELMTPYSPIFITQEKHYAYTLGAGVAFTPLEREWILKRLEDQHPSWTSDEVEEALERLNAQKLVTCPCSEHMNKKSVAVRNVPMIMRKLEDLEKIADQINDDKDESQEEEEVNELESDTNSDSGIAPDSSEIPDDNTSSEKDGDEEMDKSKPCPFCGKFHPIQNVFFKSNPSGFLVRFKIVPKENKDEEKGEEKEEKKEEVE